MNKLKTDINGKFPLFLNDIRFLDEAYRMALEAFARAITKEENVILYGIDITIGIGEVGITEGVVVIENEILFVAAGEITFPAGNKPVIIKDTSWDPEGNKLFGDGETHDTYQIIKGVLSVISEIGGGTDNIDLLNSPERITDIKFATKTEVLVGTSKKWLSPELLQDHEDWTTVTLADHWSHGSTPLQYRKLTNGMLHIRGIAKLDNDGYTTIFTLPVAYRPLFNMIIMTGKGNTATEIVVSFAGISVNYNSEGNVRVEYLDDNSTARVGAYFFNNIISLD